MNTELNQSELLNLQGYVIYKNIIPNDFLEKVKKSSIILKENILQNNLLETPKEYGTPKFCRHLDMASKFDPELYELYTSNLMLSIAKDLLKKDSIYLFNDQLVVKMPHEEFSFVAHTDNTYGPDPQAAINGNFRTITCAWVITDLTENNGPISILNKQTNQWDTPLAKAGDLIVWDGNTTHQSGKNESDNPRIIWVLVYSTHNLSQIKNVNDLGDMNTVDFTRFHTIKV
jgi:ectoine hydroxylase-related dioxygenase (phytanoyl-CoA dioxygenase family)